jgi:hypothetical protein
VYTSLHHPEQKTSTTFVRKVESSDATELGSYTNIWQRALQWALWPSGILEVCLLPIWTLVHFATKE